MIFIPLIVLFAMYLLQVALAFFAQDVATGAARSALAAASDYGGTNRQGQTQAGAYIDAVGPGIVRAPDVSVTRTATAVTVRVRARVVAVVPGHRWMVEAQVSGPIERFVQ